MSDGVSTERVDEFDVAIVGAGFAGVYQLHRLRQRGFRVVLLEAAADLGGIWQANCYPGARVDSHVPLYEFSDETVWRDWWWEERFPDWRALRAYFDHVDRVWDIRRDVRFHTRVDRGGWDETSRTWTLHTSGPDSDRGDRVRTRFVVLCTGFASKPYVPDLPGLASFAGECHHTARWPAAGIDLTGLRVGVIGTGASGVQVIQEAAAVAEEVTVFQRTPMLGLPMRQQRLTRADQERAKQGAYQRSFRLRTETNSGFDFTSVGPSSFAVSDAERLATYERCWEDGGFALWVGGYTDTLLDDKANRLVYDFWRDRVRERIADDAAAELLAPMEPPHPFGVKRPSLEQNYYDVFNQDNVGLVDVRTDPIEAITATGIRTSSERPFDLIVLATGFDAVTGGLTAIDLRGPTGASLADHWRGGVRTHLGLASTGFPNLVYLYGPQSPSGFCNGPTCAELQGDWVVDLLTGLRDRGVTRVEAEAAAEEAWREQVVMLSSTTLFPRADSWYMGANIPGKTREMLNWPGGLQLYLAACQASADDGYAGFTLS